MKLYVRLVDLELHFPNTLSNAKMTYVSNVDLVELYNFVSDDFFSWNHLLFQNLVWSCHFLNLKFEFLKQCPMEKWPK